MNPFKTILFLAVIAGLAWFIKYEMSSREPDTAARHEQAPLKGEQVATFAEGCFWHSELVFQSLVGVREAVTGYAGGTDTLPSYGKVSNGTTGHAECVQVYYNPRKISYQTLVRAFFASHDPTSLNRQGQDVGTEYRSIAFYRNPGEKQIIMSTLDSLKQQGKYKKEVVTEIIPIKTFYPAEKFHQEYAEKHPDSDYIKYVSLPELLEFKLSFEASYKPITYF